MSNKHLKEVERRYSMEHNGGFDGLFIFLLVVSILTLLIGIPCAVCGFIFLNDSSASGMAALAYAGCGLTALSVLLIIFITVRRKLRVKKYNAEYRKWKSLPESKKWKWLDIELPKKDNSPAAKALRNAAMRAAWGYVPSSSGSTGTNSSDNSMRVKLKDGKELHTEERFGDYKTYLYDERGKNTGLHVQGDRVLDDNYNEVGSFDSSGKFNPKN